MANANHKLVDFDAELVGGAVEFSGITRLNYRNDKGGDYYLITFYLDDDDTGLGLRFRPMTTDPNLMPFWIQPIVNGCPTAAATMPGVVEPLFVSPSGKELTVINYNTASEEMRFALRLIDSTGVGHDYDPIINNQNGGDRLTLAKIATVAVTALSVGTVLYVGLGGGLN